MNDASAQLFVSWRGPVQDKWVDYNGHLRDAYYLLIFSLASDGVMDLLGLDTAGRSALGHTLFTLETHLNYLHEVKGGARVEVRTQVLGHDHKRLHIFHTLRLQGSEEVLACNEQMLVNVAMVKSVEVTRTTSFAPVVLRKLRALYVQHQAMGRPVYAGRVIALR